MRYTIFVAGSWVRTIVVDPVEGKLYFTDNQGIQAINVDGSNRTKLHPYTGAYGMDVDLKKG